MNKRPLILASNHHTFRIAPSHVDRESVATAEPTPGLFVHAIEYSIKKQLLKFSASEEGIEVFAAGLRPIRLVVKRYGQTALVAAVLRGKDKIVESLTVCRTGLDNEDDYAAITAAGALLMDGQNDPDVRDHVESLINEILDQPRPMAVHIHFDATNFDDRAVRVVTHCVAESFFDLFGLDKTLQAPDV